MQDYKKFLNRSLSLLQTEFWQEGEKETSKITGGEFFFDPIFIYTGGKGTDIYYNLSDPKQDPQRLVKFTDKHPDIFYNFADIYEKDCDALLALIEKKDTEDFTKIHALVLKIWPMRIISSTLAGILSETANKNVVERATELRKKYEKLSYNTAYTLIDIAKKIIPTNYLPYVEFLTFKEITEELPSIEDLEKRKNGYVLCEGEVILDKDGFLQKNNIHLIQETVEHADVLKGTIANKGIVRGTVRLIFEASQLNKVEEGDILVTTMTTPNFLPGMQKASAFITDEGGILCHAAIVAREMNKPCIIGTKFATQVLKDGDLVEVDANNGIVRIK